MKSLKMLGLAVLAMLFSMAFVGVPSVAAEGQTALCDSEGEPEGSEEPGEVENGCLGIEDMHATSVGKGVLLTNLANIECSVLFSGAVGEETSPLTIEGKFTYTECKTNSGIACEIKEVNGPALLEGLRTNHETANVTGSGEGLISCGGFIHCVYSLKGVSGTARGPLLASQKNGEVSLQEQTLTKVSGVFCPSSAKLDLVMTPSEPTHIVNPAMVFRFRCVFVGSLAGSYKGPPCRFWQWFPFQAWEREYY